QDADVMVYERGFQPSVDNAVDQAGRTTSTTVDVTDIVAMRRYDDADSGGVVDPHVWLDPNNMMPIANAVTETVIEADPQNESSYRKKSHRLRARLRTLDRDMHDELARCEHSTIVTSHAAFGYLTDRYGLRQASVAGIDPN